MSLSINIVGAPGVGKSSFIQRHLTGEFPASQWLPTLVNLDIYTTKGWVSVTLHENGKGLTNYTVLFVDTMEGIQEQVDKYSPNLICLTKVDLGMPPVNAWDVKKTGIKFWDISMKSNYNFEKPILEALRKVFDPEICICPEPAEQVLL